VDVLAKCHVAVQNFGAGAVTCDHWMHRHVKNGGCHVQCIVIEELSQVNTYLWNDLAKVRLKGVQFILLGDWAQLSAVMDTWAGAKVPDGLLQHSDLMHGLAGGARLTLTENRRSDPPLFSFYTGLRAGTPQARPLGEALVEARGRFSLRPGRADCYLCISHETRKRVNAKAMACLKPAGSVLYERATDHPHQQSMWLWPGMKLLGAGGRCLKNCTYTVLEVTETEVTLEEEVASLRKDTVLKCLRPSFALNYAGCQGLTLRGRLRLLETDHYHFTLKHLYVGSSRATAADLLEVS
jgi:hypothetical protein